MHIKLSPFFFLRHKNNAVRKCCHLLNNKLTYKYLVVMITWLHVLSCCDSGHTLSWKVKSLLIICYQIMEFEIEVSGI